MRRSLTRRERLSGRTEVRRCFRTGRAVTCRGSKLLETPNNLPWNRLLFVPTRRYRNAVQRNRAKRIGRESYRNHKERVECGHDLIWILYPGHDTYGERSRQFLSLCQRAGILES